jgi:hypothetical protein
VGRAGHHPDGARVDLAGALGVDVVGQDVDADGAVFDDGGAVVPGRRGIAGRVDGDRDRGDVAAAGPVAHLELKRSSPLKFGAGV